MIDKLVSDFEIIKDTLNTLPKNSSKNIEKYVVFLDETISKYEENRQKVLSEIESRYKLINNFSENKDINDQKKQIESFEYFPILNPYKTPYSMIGFDKLLYDIDHFYKANLDQVNEDILKCIENLQKAGIKKLDFNYSPYVLEYINILKNEKDKDKIHKEFERIYWKCSDIILHIELNIKGIFLKNKKAISKYFEKEVSDYLNNRKLKDVFKEHKVKKIELEKLINSDRYLMIKNFENKKYNLNDFKNKTVESLYDKFKINDIENEKLHENILKLSYSLIELKGYLKYQYILDDIKEKFQNKEQYKGKYDACCKEVISLEKKLKKLNSGGLFKKKSNKKTLFQINQVINELDLKYKELEETRFNDIILNLPDDKTLYDALLIAISDYHYMVDVIKRNNLNVDDVDKIILDIKKLIFYPHLTILNNTALVEEKDMAFLISDRYVLSSLNVDLNSLKDESSIDALLDECNKVLVLEKLNKMNLTIENIEFILAVKKLLLSS